MAMARALILDFGGVISRTLFETHDLTEQSLGLAQGSLAWKGPFDPDTDELWRKFQSGSISERDYWRTRSAEVGQMVGETWTDMQTFVRRARGADPDLIIRPEATSSIIRAKEAGCRLAILSNELDLFYGADFRGRLPLINLFDVIVDATYTGILKPDPRAYEEVIDALGLPRASCVFVDDQKKNVDGALGVGLPTVQFDVMDPAASYAKALKMLGL